MAGFSCEAHRRYRIGEDQKVFGTAPDIVGLGEDVVTTLGRISDSLLVCAGSDCVPYAQ